MSGTVKIGDFSTAVDDVLTKYSTAVTEKIKKQSASSMKELVDETRSTAPVGKRRYDHYRDHIKSKKTFENSHSAVYKWYVEAPYYRLSHLLNNGHALRNGGRYAGTQFIGKAVEKVEKSYTEKVKEIIQDG